MERREMLQENKDWATLFALLNPEQPPVPEPDDWERVAALGRDGRVSALLYEAVCKRQPGLPSPVRRRFRYHALQQSAVSLKRLRQLPFVLRALVGAGVPVIVLKGASLAYELYQTPTLRAVADLDLLIPEQALEQAITALSPLGFSLDSSQLEPSRRAASYHIALASPAVTVELHWTLGRNISIPLEELWQRSARSLHFEASVLDPVDELIYLAFHMVKHKMHVHLHHLCDLSYRVHQGLPEPQRLDLLARSRAWRLESKVLLALRLVERALPGREPSRILEQTGGVPPALVDQVMTRLTMPPAEAARFLRSYSRRILKGQLPHLHPTDPAAKRSTSWPKALGLARQLGLRGKGLAADLLAFATDPASIARFQSAQRLNQWMEAAEEVPDS